MIPKFGASGRQASAQGRAEVFVENSVPIVFIGYSELIHKNSCSVALKVFQIY